jgi:hypothetical protein
MKIILLYGTGKGKTFLRDALGKHYSDLGIPYHGAAISRVEEAVKLVQEPFPSTGFLILDTNLPLESFVGFEFWQTVEFKGATILNQSDFLKIDTDGVA